MRQSLVVSSEKRISRSTLVDGSFTVIYNTTAKYFCKMLQAMYIMCKIYVSQFNNY